MEVVNLDSARLWPEPRGFAQSQADRRWDGGMRGDGGMEGWKKDESFSPDYQQLKITSIRKLPSSRRRSQQHQSNQQISLLPSSPALRGRGHKKNNKCDLWPFNQKVPDWLEKRIFLLLLCVCVCVRVLGAELIGYSEQPLVIPASPEPDWQLWLVIGLHQRLDGH